MVLVKCMPENTNLDVPKPVYVRLWCLVWSMWGYSCGVDGYILGIGPGYVEGPARPWSEGFADSFLLLFRLHRAGLFSCERSDSCGNHVKIREFSGASVDPTDYSCSFLVGVGVCISAECRETPPFLLDPDGGDHPYGLGSKRPCF